MMLQANSNYIPQIQLFHPLPWMLSTPHAAIFKISFIKLVSQENKVNDILTALSGDC